MSEATALRVKFNVSEIITGLSDGDFLNVPIEYVSVKEGFNHRSYFDINALGELADDIRRNNITQPLVVRPNADSTAFSIVAGERRYRAAELIGLSSLPVIVRLVSDAQAHAISASENLQREDVSPAEEAGIAHAAIGHANGKRSKAVELLGWSRAKLDARMLLLHCDEAVLAALSERAIRLGHAELLAGLSKPMQVISLKGVIEKDVSVADLKASIGRYAYQLNTAVFNTADCSGCEHNSAQSADLFSTSIGAGNCLNRECFDKKTLSFLKRKKASLSDQHNVVYFDSEKPTDQRVFLVREGDNAVGRTQFSACQGCAFYGAVMRTDKSHEGTLEPGVCFNTKCNTDKVKAHSKSLRPTLVPDATTKVVGTPVKPKKKTPSVPAVSAKMVEFTESLHFRAAGSEVPNDARMVSAVALFSLITHASGLADAVTAHLKSQSLLEPANELIKLRDKRLLAALLKLSRGETTALTAAFASNIVGKDHQGHIMSKELSRVVLHDMKVPIERYFVMSADYLGLLVISAILETLKTSGFKAWYIKTNSTEDFAKLIKANKGQLIKNILGAGFDWTGFVPKQLALPE